MDNLRNIFRELNVADFGRGMAPALVAKILVELGANVYREASSSPDPFDEMYPAYSTWQDGKLLVDRSKLLDNTDVVLLGGEDFPGLQHGPNAAQLLADNPRLVIAEIVGAPPGLPCADRPAVDILAQARSGTVFEELNDRPVLSAIPLPSYGAALQVLTGLFAALFEREVTGRGQIVASSLFEGALTYGTPFWYTAGQPDPSFDFMPPKSPKQMIFRCADGEYVQIVLGVPGAKAILYKVFGLDATGIDPSDRGVGGDDPEKFYGEYALFAPLFATRTRADICDALVAAGLPNVEVLPPGGCWNDRQVQQIDALVEHPDGSCSPRAPFHLALNEGGDTPKEAGSAAGSLPLGGVRVLDLGAWVAGPFASVPLADLGADVIKVEPIEGDPHRYVHRSFAGANRGKRSIAVNLKSPLGMEVLWRLVESADILHHNFRPGVSKRLGIDPEALHAFSPDLIVLESSAFGQTGPRSSRPGFDQLFQAFCGHEMRAAAAGNPPFWSRLVPVDTSTGLASAAASTISLYLRQRTGAGVSIDASLLRTGLFLLSELVRGPDGEFIKLSRIDSQQMGFHPAERLYRTADGWIAVAARGEEMARRFCDVLGLEGRISSPRQSWGDVEASLLAQAIGTLTTSQLIEKLDDADVWAEVCDEKASEQLLANETMLRTGTVGRSHHALYGEVSQVASLLRLPGRQPAYAKACPVLGEHTDEIMAGLGYDSEQINEMRLKGIIR